jgi:hypothetical protein
MVQCEASGELCTARSKLIVMACIATDMRRVARRAAGLRDIARAQQ